MLNKILISKQNLINNIKQAKQSNKQAKVCAMVKANAYGVGLKEVVQTLTRFVDYFGVACFFEAKKLQTLTDKKILIVGPLEHKVDLRFSYTCSSLKDVEDLASKGLKINIHLKVNSGMNRFGFSNLKEFEKALFVIKNSKLNLEGLFTHFATNDDFVDEQYKKFCEFARVCHNLQLYPIIHADNSAVSLFRNHNLDMIRVGYNLYLNNKDGFKPVMEIASQVVQINNIKKGELVGYNRRFVAPKDMKVAVLPVGYADGFSIKFCGLKLNLCGKQCKVLNVCMDCFMLDVSGLNIKKGDEIYLVDKLNPLTKYAEYVGTSVYEISTNFSHMRAKRKLVSVFER